MEHVVLLGDSIFDNARYVPGLPAVIDQVRQALPQGWGASLLAIDGHVTEDVAKQITLLPTESTHLIVSVGGNDALSESGLLNETVVSVGEALTLIHELGKRFRQSYRSMLSVISPFAKPTAVCTIYDSIPELGAAEQAALAGFNEIILREAFLARLPVIDLRIVCDQSADYSDVSPIEPSAAGGAKIARVIAELLKTHNFDARRCAIYG